MGQTGRPSERLGTNCGQEMGVAGCELLNDTEESKTKSVSRVMNTNENTALALRIRKLCLPISCDDGEHVGGRVRKWPE